MDFLDKLKNLIKTALISGPVNNSSQFGFQQISYKGKTSDCFMIFSYGHYANCSSNDTLVTVFEVDGNEDNKYGIGFTPKKRPIDLEPGEHAVYHPETETFIKFRNNADIIITTGTVDGTKGNIIVNCNNLTANVDNDAIVTVGSNAIIDAGNNLNLIAQNNINITATANVNVTCDNATMTISTLATFDVPNATFTGNVQIDGTLGVTQDFNLTGNAALGAGGLAIARKTDATDGSTIIGGSANHTAT